MTNLLFLVYPEDLEEIRDLKELLATLPQNEADLADSSHADAYGKLFHIRRLRLEEITTELVLLGAYDEYELGKRSSLLDQAARQSLTVIEVSDPAKGSSFDSDEEDVFTPDFEDTAPIETDDDGREESATRVVRIGLERAMRGRLEPTNLGIFPHISITAALRSFLYQDGRASVELPITYSDGSQARSFPLLALEQARLPNNLTAAPIFKIGMVSIRHPEMDHVVDFYWFRNQQVSVNRATAETDEVAYQWSKKLLAQARADGWLMRIAFYQTGFPPAAIGFYRAVAEELLESRRTGKLWLEVTPRFYNKRSGEYEDGEVWS